MRWPFNFSQKATEIHRAVVKIMSLTPTWTKRNYENFAKEGYNANVWVYRCIQAIAQGAAGVDWDLYQVDSQGERKEIGSHELLKLLNKPNEFMSRSEFIEAFAAYALISGNSYMDMVGPNDNAAPKELWVYRPDRMTIATHPTEFISGYVYTIGGDKIPLDKKRVAHLKFFSPIDDFYGLGPLQVGARGIDNDNAANAWNNSLLTNGARPGGALVTEEVLTEAQYTNLKSELDNNYRGAQNAGKPLLLEGGLKWQEMSLSPREMDFVSSKKMSILEICAAFGVPPEVVGYGESKTYSNYQEARKALYEDAVIPMLDKIRDKFNSSLVPKFGDNIILDYDRDGIEALKENSDTEANRVREDYNKGLISLNEAREARGYGTIPGGDVHLIPGNNWVVDENNNVILQPKRDTQSDNGDEGQTKSGGFFLTVKALNIETDEQKKLYWKSQENGREKFYQDVEDEVKAEFEIERKAVLKAYKSGGIKEVDKLLNARRKDWGKLYTAVYVQVMDVFGNALMDQFKKDDGIHMETKAPKIPLETIFRVFDKAVQKFIASTVAKKVVGVTNKTKELIRGRIAKGEAAGESIDQIASRIDDLYLKQIIPNRSVVIARTEVIGASNAGNSYAADQTGLKLNKQWLSTPDDRTRETHVDIDGEERPKEEKYSNGLMFPGDPDGAADEVIQCRCTETYSVIE